MIGKKQSEELITTEEAVQIGMEAGDAVSCGRALQIFRAAIEAATKRRYRSDFIEICALSIVYDAGRIQGIREERARRKARKIETA